MTRAGSACITPHSSVYGYDRVFAYVHIERAASTIGLITIEEYEIVVSSLHHLHVYRVYRLKREMDNHPADGNGMPRPVREALADLSAVEDVLRELKVPRLSPQEMREHIDALEVRDALRL